MTPPKPLALMSYYELQDEWIKAGKRLRVALTEETRRDRARWLQAIEAELLKRRTRA
jgi:hypothetical protein